MRGLKFALQSIIFLLMTVNMVFAQDSTRLYSTPFFKVKKLAEIALKAKSAETVISAQEHTIQAGLDLQASTDSLLAIKMKELALCNQAREDFKDLYSQQIKVTRTEIKKKRKWFLLFLGVTAVAVAEAIKGL